MPASYVSAEWVNFDDGIRVIKAIGDDGKEYWVPELMSDVPPWPEFLAANVERAAELRAEAEAK